MELAVARGENRFSMKRGSFCYKQSLRNRRALVREKTEQTKEGRRLGYRDPVTGELVWILVTETRDGCKIAWEANQSLDVNRYWITFPTNSGEHIYGCGETYSKLDLKGEKVRIWVAEHQNSRRISGKIIREKFMGRRPQRTQPFDRYESYYAQPTFVSSDRYYVHADVNTYSEFDFTVPDKTTLYFQEAPSLVIERADSFPQLSEKLSALLGRQRELPDWIYDGVILGIQEGTAVVEKKLRRVQEAGGKVCGVWCQDWSGCRRTGFGYQVMWNWQWDRELYPELDRKIRSWRKEGVRFLGYINPFLAIEKELYREAAEKGYCVKNARGEDYLVTITTFPAAMVDFTNPAAYDWYKKLIQENMIGLGMGGWMADFGEYLPVDAVLYDGSDPAVMHNRWPAIWAKLNQEAIAECGMEKEIFFFTRAGHTGTIAASAMMWTGDQHVDWSVDDGLPSVIPATLSLAMSGYGIAHSDAGGYTTIMHMRRSKELLMRWEEMNVFSPLLRTHEGNQPVNNVQFDSDEELLAHMGSCSRMHAALKGYLKELVRCQQEKGTPVMRPLFYHYDEDEAYGEATEYLLGEDVLVAPVCQEGATGRSCYLPKDHWVHLFSGKSYQGGRIQVEAPLGQPPVFVRRDSVHYEELMKAAGAAQYQEKERDR